MKVLDQFLRFLDPPKITDEATMRDSKTFCMLPWVHLYVSPHGYVNPCCLAPWEKDQILGDLNQQSFTEIWNGAPMRDLRKKMLRDQPDSKCWQCYENERLGIRSKRQNSNLQYLHHLDHALQTHQDGQVTLPKPLYWDIRVSNLCNFKCRICGHHSSSKWYEDAKKLDMLSFEDGIHRSVKNFDDLLTQLAPFVTDLEEIYFAGGEPLVMEEHYNMLELLLSKGKTNIKLRYSTNFSTRYFKGRDVFELWNQFDEVFLHASLDGSGKRGELQRKGQVWDDAVALKEQLKAHCPRVQFMICSTITAMNVLHLPDFHQEWVALGLVAADDFIPHILKQPQRLSIQILPPALKQQVVARYTAHLAWLDSFDDPSLVKMHIVRNEYASVISFIQDQDKTDLLPDFITFTDKLDALRGESFRDIFPELAAIWAESKPMPR
jgi:MoaA/NifB/PqqE/SkfB family radical SAM enzyme